MSINPILPVIVAAGRKGRSSDGMLKVYNARSGTVLLVVAEGDAGRGGFCSTAFARDGETLAAGTDTGAVIVWKLRVAQDETRAALTESCGLSLPGSSASAAHRPRATCMSFGSRNDLLAVGCSDHLLRLFRLPDGELEAVLSGHSGEISAVAFSADGTLLASAGGGDGSVRVWDVRSLTERFSLERGTGIVTDLAFDCDGKLLVAAYGRGMAGYSDAAVALEHSQEQLRFWDLSNGLMQRAFFVGGDRVNCVSLACVNGLVAAGYTHREASEDNSVAILDAEFGHRLATISGRWVSPTARWLPSGRVVVIFAGARIGAWNVEDPKQPKELWATTWHWLDRATDESAP